MLWCFFDVNQGSTIASVALVQMSAWERFPFDYSFQDVLHICLVLWALVGQLFKLLQVCPSLGPSQDQLFLSPLFCFGFWDRVSLCSSGWPRSHGNPPASASWLLGLQACVHHYAQLFPLSWPFFISLDALWFSVRSWQSGWSSFIWVGLEARFVRTYLWKVLWWTAQFQILSPVDVCVQPS